MLPYKLIACDLDGTLLRDDMTVSDENLRAISALARRGVSFVPCSGRTLREIDPAIARHPDIRWIIYANGAVILDRLTGEKTLRCLSFQRDPWLARLLLSCDVHLTLRQGGQTFTDAASYTDERMTHCRVYAAHRSVLRDFSQRIEDLHRRMMQFTDIEAISVFFHSDEELARCREQIHASGTADAVTLEGVNLEIFAAGAGKGRALHTLCGKLGLDPAQTIGVGDSGNDLPLMEAAGLSLAVSNGASILKQAADRVICSNEEHIVPWILEHILL